MKIITQEIQDVYMSSTEVCRGLLCNYSELLTESLRIGLSKNDLRLMLRRDPFYFETHHSIKLQKQLVKLRDLQSRLSSSSVVNAYQTERFMRRLLLSKIRSCSGKWNPALLPTPMVPHGLAPVSPAPFELLIYVIPSPYGFDWRSPLSVLFSLRNYLTLFKHHSIGHMAVELRRGGQTVALTGMTGETNWQILNRLRDTRIGLDFLFSTYPGRLEDAFALWDDLRKHAKWRKLGYIRLELGEDAFHEQIEFLRNWVEQGQYQKYGLVHDPAEDTGAGCATFALHFLRLAGQISETFETYCTRRICIPKVFLGVRTRDLVANLLFSKYINRWAAPHEEHKVLKFCDPDLAYEWILAHASEGYSAGAKGVSL